MEKYKFGCHCFRTFKSADESPRVLKNYAHPVVYVRQHLIILSDRL